MGYLRFHRSMRIMPGVRLNLAKTGPSLSLGVNGARVNLGAQGVRTTVGLPGSGLSYITRTPWLQVASNPHAVVGTVKPLGEWTPAEIEAYTAANPMTPEQSRANMVAGLATMTKAQIIATRDAFQAYCRDHAAEVATETDKAEILGAEKAFSDAITAREDAAFSHRKNVFWSFALICGLLAHGVFTGNPYTIFAGLACVSIFACTATGQRIAARCFMVMLAIVGITIMLGVLGMATLVVMAMSGNLPH